MEAAGDAVDTLRVLSRWFVLLGEVRLCVYPSAGTISIHLPSDYIYPYRCVGGSRSQHCAPRGGVGRDNSTCWCLPRAAESLVGRLFPLRIRLHNIWG